MGARLPVVLLWHMHQPQYRDAFTGEYVQPWTTLHALKDYADMAAHLEANPAARAVVNFTPVLLEQLEDLAGEVRSCLEGAAALHDPVLASLVDAAPIDPAKRLALLRALLRAQRAQMIEPLPVFRELVDIATTLATPERIAYASDALIADLAVWYHLAWTGETIRRGDARVAALMAQGRGFGPADRHRLLSVVGDTLAAIVPRYRALAAAGRCELAVSPYSHPILPLLCDFAAARESLPDSPLPQHAAYPGGRVRADWHMAEAIRVFTRIFGQRPVGCWPSEGAVSRETLEVIERHGFAWVASSAGVLHGSVPEAEPNRPYRLRGQKLNCWFRDDGLSDLIGFTYANWHGDDAVAHFVGALAQLAQRDAAPGRHAVLVALDGENAWEHYPQNGYHFLKGLYAALAEHPALELTTLGALGARNVPVAELSRVRAGSWVHATLATWIGDADKNAGWDLLCEAKIAYDRALAGGRLSPTAIAAAERQLALCESSDWFWWFGDYNPAEAVAQFDQLYRRQLTTLYRLLALEPPATLDRPISLGGGAMEQGGVMRRATAG
ncbi:MAG TPA: glycoside hydrolase family 57 protein [Steroidobacteraceae bacterium]|nr:glycoside hydrolase family 57 protein [Steroidobacteraceae bacterium]HQZ79801.1 glycoside hydrolase family 57 protein [Steroidobacteraceae bacterium]